MNIKMSPMRRLRKVSSHKLTKKEPRVYVFRNRKDGPIRYVGRSDINLKKRLKNRPYARYHFINTQTDLEAYQIECELWHEHQPTIDNAKVRGGRHPAKPAYTDIHCPVCRRGKFKKLSLLNKQYFFNLKSLISILCFNAVDFSTSYTIPLLVLNLTPTILDMSLLG
jgi:hypothetical protein